MRTYKRWTAKAKSLLGTAPDRVIARRLRRTLRAVQFMRQHLGIEAFKAFRPWPESDLAVLRKVSLVEFTSRLPALVKQFKRSAASIRSRHRRELGLWTTPKQALARSLAA